MQRRGRSMSFQQKNWDENELQVGGDKREEIQVEGRVQECERKYMEWLWSLVYNISLKLWKEIKIQDNEKHMRR